MRPVTLHVDNPREALKELERASHDGDNVDIAQNFVIDNPAFVQTVTLNTTTPTAANCALVLATLITIMKKGGFTRTT